MNIRKPHFSLTLDNQRKNRRLIEKKLNDLNLFLNSMNLEFKSNLFQIKEKTSDTIFLNARVLMYKNNLPIQWGGDKIISNMETQSEEVETENKYTQTDDIESWIFKCLQIKDKLSISNEKLIYLSDLFTNKTQKISIITQGNLNNLKSKFYDIFGKINKIELSDDLIGFYYSIKTKVEYFVGKFIEKYLEDKQELENKKISIESFKKKYLLIQDNVIWLKFGGLQFLF